MPKYRFVCKDCSADITKLVKLGTKKCDCICGKTMDRQMPSLNKTDVTETVDKYRNVKWHADQRDLVKQRHEEYFWKHEVPRMVSSGVYELTTMVENEWIIITDDGKIEIQDKPPHKR